MADTQEPLTLGIPSSPHPSDPHLGRSQRQVGQVMSLQRVSREEYSGYCTSLRAGEGRAYLG